MKRKHHILLLLFFILYFATFLPNLGIFNTLTWIGPFPLPMAWVLFLNAINTIILLIICKQFFIPFAKRVEKEFEEEEES